MDEFNIGAKLRLASQKKNMSMKKLASMLGCSVSLISLIENSKISPPIKTLSGIAKALNLSLAKLFEDDEELARFEITKSATCKTKPVTPPEGGLDPDGRLRQKGIHTRKLKHKFITLPNRHAPYMKFMHSEESLVYVVKGKAEILLGSQLIPLEEGDSVYFETNTAHGLRSTDDSETLILEVDAA